jgi:hypothetical protein
MLKDSAERWLAVKDRSVPGNQVLITVDGVRLYYLSHNPLGMDGWVCDEGPLVWPEAADFFAEFGASARVWIGCIRNGMRLRAFVKNGTHEGWNQSLEQMPVQQQ